MISKIQSIAQSPLPPVISYTANFSCYLYFQRPLALMLPLLPLLRPHLPLKQRASVAVRVAARARLVSAALAAIAAPAASAV